MKIKATILALCTVVILSGMTGATLDRAESAALNQHVSLVKWNFLSNLKLCNSGLFEITEIKSVPFSQPMELMKTSKPGVFFVVTYDESGAIDTININVDGSLPYGYIRDVYALIMESTFLYPSVPKMQTVDTHLSAINIHQETTNNTMFQSGSGDMIGLHKEVHGNVITITVYNKSR